MRQDMKEKDVTFEMTANTREWKKKTYWFRSLNCDKSRKKKKKLFEKVYSEPIVYLTS